MYKMTQILIEIYMKYIAKMTKNRFKIYQKPF